MSDLNTKVTILEPRGRATVGNIILEDAKFFGRPNLGGQTDRFGDDRRKFQVRIPEAAVETLLPLGWQIKSLPPQTEEGETLHFLKVFADFKFDPKHPGDPTRENGPTILAVQGDNREVLTSQTVGIIDRSKVQHMAMQIRGWEYNPQEHPGKLSARLVEMAVTLEPSILTGYGR